MNIKKVNIVDKFSQFSGPWDPKIVGELNGQHIKLARFNGEFVMHRHIDEDEMFLVLEGKLLLKTKNNTFILNPGEFIIVPKGIYHQPIAENEVKLMLFEPKATLNTGNIKNKFTVRNLDML